MSDPERKLLESLRAIPPMTRAQAKAKLREMVLELQKPARRHAYGALEAHRQERHTANINTLLLAIQDIPDHED